MRSQEVRFLPDYVAASTLYDCTREWTGVEPAYLALGWNCQQVRAASLAC